MMRVQQCAWRRTHSSETMTKTQLMGGGMHHGSDTVGHPAYAQASTFAAGTGTDRSECRISRPQLQAFAEDYAVAQLTQQMRRFGSPSKQSRKLRVSELPWLPEDTVALAPIKTRLDRLQAYKHLNDHGGRQPPPPSASATTASVASAAVTDTKTAGAQAGGEISGQTRSGGAASPGSTSPGATSPALSEEDEQAVADAAVVIRKLNAVGLQETAAAEAEEQARYHRDILAAQLQQLLHAKDEFVAEIHRTMSQSLAVTVTLQSPGAQAMAKAAVGGTDDAGSDLFWDAMWPSPGTNTHNEEVGKGVLGEQGYSVRTTSEPASSRTRASNNRVMQKTLRLNAQGRDEKGELREYGRELANMDNRIKKTAHMWRKYVLVASGAVEQVVYKFVLECCVIEHLCNVRAPVVRMYARSTTTDGSYPYIDVLTLFSMYNRAVWEHTMRATLRGELIDVKASLSRQLLHIAQELHSETRSNVLRQWRRGV